MSDNPADGAWASDYLAASGEGGVKNFRARDGQLFRHSEQSGWWPMDDAFAGRLWAVYRATGDDPSDWFSGTAGKLADELAQAIRDANEQRNRRRAA